MMKSLAHGVVAAEPRCAQSSAASALAANELIGVSEPPLPRLGFHDARKGDKKARGGRDTLAVGEKPLA